MNSPKQSPFALLFEPLPESDHPLGGLALAWLFANCVFLGGALTATLALLLVVLGVVACGGRVTPGVDIIPPTLQAVIGVASFAVGMFLGALGGAWLIHRAGRQGVRFGLLTLALMPLIGTPISIACGIISIYRWVQTLFTKHATDIEIER